MAQAQACGDCGWRRDFALWTGVGASQTGCDAIGRCAGGGPVQRARAPVNARVGPGEDYKALWTFQAHGVPLQVVEESGDWRRVCDPEGGLAWVRARALDSRRTVMRIALSDLPMRRAPSTDAKVTAVLAARATAQLLTCRAGWCRISVDHASGWVRADEVWGAGDGPQCKGG
jgi:SH3-like domain-containing protein